MFYSQSSINKLCHTIATINHDMHSCTKYHKYNSSKMEDLAIYSYSVLFYTDDQSLCSCMSWAERISMILHPDICLNPDKPPTLCWLWDIWLCHHPLPSYDMRVWWWVLWMCCLSEPWRVFDICFCSTKQSTSDLVHRCGQSHSRYTSTLAIASSLDYYSLPIVFVIVLDRCRNLST